MKKTYMMPTTKVVEVKLQSMIAGSPDANMYGKNATSTGMSRENSSWGWEEYE